MADIDAIVHDTITRYCNERDIPTGPMFFLTDRIVFALQQDFVIRLRREDPLRGTDGLLHEHSIDSRDDE